MIPGIVRKNTCCVVSIKVPEGEITYSKKIYFFTLKYNVCIMFNICKMTHFSLVDFETCIEYLERVLLAASINAARS